MIQAGPIVDGVAGMPVLSLGFPYWQAARIPDLWVEWLGGRDSNPDTQLQRLQSYH